MSILKNSTEFKKHVIESYEYDLYTIDPTMNMSLFICQYALKYFGEKVNVSFDEKIECIMLYSWLGEIYSDTNSNTLSGICNVSQSGGKFILNKIKIFIDESSVHNDMKYFENMRETYEELLKII